MRYNKIFVFIFFLSGMGKGTTLIAQSPVTIKWIVEQNSTLRVEGGSNVNSFTCNITEHTERDTIICFNDISGPVRLSGEMHINVLSFNCHSDFITQNLKKTLKAEQYPKMIIRFISLQYIPTLQNKTELVKGLVEIELAGVVKRFELCYSFLRTAYGYIQLNGGRGFRFSDFKLSAPRKFGGLVRIKDDFDVYFQLILRTA